MGIQDHKEGPCACEFCGKLFQSHKGVLHHISLTHPEHHIKKCKCDICGKDISNKGNLALHKMRVHKVKYENRAITNDAEKVLCDICGSPVWPTNLRAHVRSHADDANKPKKCTFAVKSFPPS